VAQVGECLLSKQEASTSPQYCLKTEQTKRLCLSMAVFRCQCINGCHKLFTSQLVHGSDLGDE
jgi:hypothetical protein